jgi:hypothetical protein
VVLSAPTPTGRDPVPSLVLAALVAASAGATLWIELRLFDLRVFYNWDVWFNADTNWYLNSFAADAFSSLRHPSIGPVIGGIVEWLARGLHATHVSAGPVEATRVWLALLVVPAAAALRTLVVFDFVRTLARRLMPAVLVCTVDIAGFATVTVGAVPESYPLSAACIATMFWLVADETPRAAAPRGMLWALTGAAAVGVTVTNAIPLTILLAVDLIRRRTPVRRAIALTTVTVAFAAGANFAVIAGHGQLRADSLGEGIRRNQSGMRAPSAMLAGELTWMMGHTFLAPRPAVEDTWATRALNPEYLLQFSFSPGYTHGWGSWWRALVTLALIAFGVAGFSRHRGAGPLLAAPILIVAANFGLHLFFGDHYALYALHWSTALLWLITGVTLLRGCLQRYSIMALAAFVVVTVLNSAMLLRELLRTLETV